MKVDELLEDLTDLLEDSKELPVVNKVMVDKGQITDIIDEIKANLPAETRQAKRVVSERNKIIEEARNQAQTLISAANKRRTDMLENQEIVKEARIEAQRIIAEAQDKARKIETAASTYLDTVFQKTEEALMANLKDFRTKRQMIVNVKNGATRVSQPVAQPKQEEQNVDIDISGNGSDGEN